jgi:hypothetical protein
LKRDCSTSFSSTHAFWEISGTAALPGREMLYLLHGVLMYFTSDGSRKVLVIFNEVFTDVTPFNFRELNLLFRLFS